MGTQYSWADELEKAAKAFGGSYPDAALEQELLEVFRERPAFVVDKIKDVTGGYEAGRIKSPWPFLRKSVGESVPDVVVSDSGDRDGAVKRARVWLKTCGLYLESEAEVRDELFGDRGQLRGWPELEGELLALWSELRPAGAELERDVETRMANWRATRERLAQARPGEGEDWVGEEPPLTAAAGTSV